jgi:RNA polymerase sigma-70 factor, ECF subfamily
LTRDSAALKQALIDLTPKLRAFALSLSGNADRANDLVQETLLKAWHNIAHFEEGTNLRAWLFTILRNTYFSECRKRRREVEDRDGALAAELTVSPTQPGHMDLQDLRQALDRLPPDHREALILIGGAGFSYEEAAEICGVAVGTIKSRVNRARNKLAQVMGLPTGGVGPQHHIKSSGSNLVARVERP